MSRGLVVLHTNDLHGQLSAEKASRLATLRSDADLYFDSGDAIKAGNLALPIGEDPVWGRLADLGCTASCPGNRESHVLETGLAAKMRGLRHPLVCANWFRTDGSLVFSPSIEIEVGGVKVGVAGVMVPMVTEGSKTKALSAFRWTDPMDAARREAEKLRSQVDCLILLSHIGHQRDLALAEKVPNLDLVLGGHSHTVVAQPVRVGRTWVCQGGSHARYYGRYEWSNGVLSGGLTEW